MKITLWCSDSTGNEKNCIYPYEKVCGNADELKEAVKRDHVAAEYKNFRRGNANFLSSTVAVMDCDNDHSENPADWITVEAMKKELSDVKFAIIPSRHHMKAKDGKAARPKFHVYFVIPKITDAKGYAELKRRIYEEYPFFDSNALDAGRFIYGNDSAEAVWNDGRCTIDELLELKQSQRVIHQGSRNSSMSRFAGKLVIRFAAPKYETETKPVITIDEAAQNVLLGKYGNGEKRRNALQALGLDADAIQRRVNELVKGAKAEYVIVKSGDTLSQIAERYGTSAAAIIKLNSALIKNPDCIRVGWKIRVK